MTKNRSIEDVVAYLKKEIKLGRLVPGQRLAEVDITSATGTSRAKVRAALQNLAVEGLVTIEPNRGASVRRITEDEIVQLYRVREVLEGLAARTVAEDGEASSLKKIKALQSQMDECVKSLDFLKFGDLNEQWHSAILRESGNSYLLASRDRLMIPIFRSLTQLLNRKGLIDAANKDHRKITRAIVGGDADTAERLMREHVANARIQLEKDMRENRVDVA